ncbi:type 1 fimbrial protein [Salmonella enterica]|nr:type 1 fimbrial protein [Salmonella enterica]ELC4947056.1 type 1 fimbrial protein [Salmonella enterica]
MKGMKSLFLLGTALAVMSSSALADTTGTQTFAASISDSTCVINGLNVTKTVSLMRNSVPSVSGGHNLIDPIDMGLSLTGCSSKSVDVGIDIQNGDAHHWGDVQLGGVSGLFTRVSIAKDGVQTIANNWGGGVKNYAITKGAVNIPVFFQLMKNTSTGKGINSGTFSYVADVVITEK